MGNVERQASHHRLLFLCLQIRSSPIITPNHLRFINEFCQIRYGEEISKGK